MRHCWNSLAELELVLYSNAPSRIKARTHIHERICFAFEIGGVSALAEYCEARLQMGVDNIFTASHLNRCIHLALVAIGKEMRERQQRAELKAKQEKLRQEMMPSLIRERQQQRLKDEEARIEHVANHIHNPAA